MSTRDMYDADYDNPYRAPDVASPSAKEVSPFGLYLGYGGFLRRFAAVFIDQILIGIVQFVIVLVLAAGLFASGVDPEEPGPQILLNLVTIAITLGYYAGMTSSSMQATLGKAALGLKVTDLQGRRISFLRAVGRELGKIVSALLLMIGYLMVLWDPRKQALHDKMAGTLVLRTR